MAGFNQMGHQVSANMPGSADDDNLHGLPYLFLISPGKCPKGIGVRERVDCFIVHACPP
jgi:hypothetical protein